MVKSDFVIIRKFYSLQSQLQPQNSWKPKEFWIDFAIHDFLGSIQADLGAQLVDCELN
jgi:hypothetical protein